MVCRHVDDLDAVEGAGLIGAVVGAIIVLFIWGMIANRSARA